MKESPLLGDSTFLALQNGQLCPRGVARVLSSRVTFPLQAALRDSGGAAAASGCGWRVGQPPDQAVEALGTGPTCFSFSFFLVSFPARPRWFSETCLPSFGKMASFFFFFFCKAGIEIENLIYQEECKEEDKHHLSLGPSRLTFGRPGCLVLTAASPGPGAQQILKKYL